jgi:D-3-phosphoglycerate dehydrogenase
VSFVNAPQLAESRGVSVRDATSTATTDFVNLVNLGGVVGDRAVDVSGTLLGRHARPRIVGINGHSVDVPPSSHMLVVRNEDKPGMIGNVGTLLGDAGVNIADMDVGTNAEGEAALMVLSTYSPVPPEVVERLRAVDGILGAQAIELD